MQVCTQGLLGYTVPGLNVAGCEAQNTAGLHSNISCGVPLLAFHSRGQLLESASQTSVACSEHSMLSRQHLSQLVSSTADYAVSYC